MSAPARTFTVRHLQLARAVFAAVAAVMITFSPDHSASVGLSAFSGFAIASGLVFALSAWLVFPAGQRWHAIVLAILNFAAGMVAGLPPLRTDDMFFAIVITWAVVTGLVELIVGLRGRRDGDVTARDGILIGAIGLLLAVLLLLIPAGFIQDYTVEDAGTYQLTGIILGVGMFGGYAAIVAVFLGIAGFTPARATTVTEAKA